MLGSRRRNLAVALRSFGSMNVKSAQPGWRTSAAEVLGISSNGLWVLVDEKEYFLGFGDFPWFKRAPVGHVLNVERPNAGHLYWPDLDVDLAVESIEHPERFPLVSEPRGKYGTHGATGQRKRGRTRPPKKAGRK